MNAFGIIAGILLAAAIFAAGVKSGIAINENTTLKADLKNSDRVLVRVKTERVIEERVVTKWRDRKETIVIQAEEIKHEIPVFVRTDCVLPPDFIVQLHAISRNSTVAALGLTEDAGAGAGCRAALEALRQSYTNHYLDAAQLNAILERETQLEGSDAS